MDRKKIGLMIRQIRIQSGLDLKGFAGKVGVSRTAVAKWETFRAAPTHEHRAQIAAVAHPMPRGRLTQLQKDNVRRQRAQLMEVLSDAAFAFSLTYKRRAHLTEGGGDE